MVNPYKSPEQSVQEEVDDIPRLWLVYQRIPASIFTTFAAGYVVFWTWQLIGYEQPLSVAEVRLWLLFIFGVLLVAFSSTSLRAKFLNAASISRYVFGVAGTFILAGVSGIFVEMFMAWYSGVEVESFQITSGLYGNHAWVFWLNLVMIAVLPIGICLHGVARRRWVVVPVLIFVCLVAAANLRAHYIFDHTDQMPSSWIQFFWTI